MKKTGILLLATLMAIMLFAGCGNQTPPASSAAPQAESQAAAPADSTTPVAESSVAPAVELVPIKGDRVKDGTYPITVSSSSSMFKIVDAQLTVKEGQMSAVLTLSGTGYGKLYMGKGEQALADDKNSIPFVENAEGKYTYTVPVAALDQETDVAAWSTKKEQWYDRVLVFESSMIAKDAIKAE